MQSKKIITAYWGLLTALAMIFSYVESMIPPVFTAVPGVKMGLPNIVILFALCVFGVRCAATVSLVRILLVSLLFGNTMIMMYSLAGGILSLLSMWLLQKTKLFSTVGLSVVGAVMHNLGQILVAMLVLETAEIGYYMIVLAVTGTLAGVLIGLASAFLSKRLGKRLK